MAMHECALMDVLSYDPRASKYYRSPEGALWSHWMFWCADEETGMCSVKQDYSI